MSEEAFIYESIRTPRGKQRNGSLHEVKPVNLVVGLVDESDLLLAGIENPARFDEPVSAAMTTNIETIAAGAPIAALRRVFDKDFVAVVVDGERFLGLITRIDLLNHLRRRKD